MSVGKCVVQLFHLLLVFLFAVSHTLVVSGGWSSLPGSELPAFLRRLGLPSAEGGSGDVAGGAAEQGLLHFNGRMA